MKTIEQKMWPVKRPIYGHQKTVNGITVTYKPDMFKTNWNLDIDEFNFWDVLIFRGNHCSDESFIEETFMEGSWQEIQKQLEEKAKNL